MGVLIFIVILVLLVIGHEFGHFIVARRAGVKVEEFGFGFPPKLFSTKKGEVEYSFNLLPFGGFVRIFGEQHKDLEDQEAAREKERSFVAQRHSVKALIIVAGVVFNMLIAWVLLSTSAMIGMPVSADEPPVHAEITDTSLIVTHVLEGSPAQEVGLERGDAIRALHADGTSLQDPTPAELRTFIGTHTGGAIDLTYRRGNETHAVSVTPEEGVVDDRKAIGIGMQHVGTAVYSPPFALWEGFTMMGELTNRIAVALFDFFASLFTGTADLDKVAGPVGIADRVGEVSEQGFVALLMFTAIISIHLAIINLIPFPALDGGRLLFIGIEAVKGSPIHPRVADTLNFIGFLLLLILIIVITYHDITRIVSG